MLKKYTWKTHNWAYSVSFPFDFGGDESVRDDDLAIDEVFRQDEYTGVGAKGDLACIAVAEKDLGFAGVFALASGEGECYCCYIFLILFYGNLLKTGDKNNLFCPPNLFLMKTDEIGCPWYYGCNTL